MAGLNLERGPAITSQLAVCAIRIRQETARLVGPLQTERTAHMCRLDVNLMKHVHFWADFCIIGFII